MNILVLCTGNSARSIMAEVLFNDLGAGRVRAYSAGSQPKDAPHPLALDTLARHGHRLDGLESKSWDAFAGSAGPELDVVITVCDSAATESCPAFPGAPAGVHWGMPDPAAVTDAARAPGAFEETYQVLKARIERFLAACPEPAGGNAVKTALEAARRDG